MNDFTKEELEDIENGLGWLCEHNPFHKVEIGKLMTKVRSMINDYCEHKVKCVSGNTLYCEDCGKEWK